MPVRGSRDALARVGARAARSLKSAATAEALPPLWKATALAVSQIRVPSCRPSRPCPSPSPPLFPCGSRQPPPPPSSGHHTAPSSSIFKQIAHALHLSFQLQSPDLCHCLFRATLLKRRPHWPRTESSVHCDLTSPLLATDLPGSHPDCLSTCS